MCECCGQKANENSQFCDSCIKNSVPYLVLKALLETSGQEIQKNEGGAA